MEIHNKCRVLTDNIDGQEAEDLMDLYNLQAFEIPPGVEAVILNLKDELESRHDWEFNIGNLEANNSELTAAERVARKTGQKDRERKKE